MFTCQISIQSEFRSYSSSLALTLFSQSNIYKKGIFSYTVGLLRMWCGMPNYYRPNNKRFVINCVFAFSQFGNERKLELNVLLLSKSITYNFVKVSKQLYFQMIKQKFHFTLSSTFIALHLEVVQFGRPTNGLPVKTKKCNKVLRLARPRKSIVI